MYIIYYICIGALEEAGLYKKTVSGAARHFPELGAGERVAPAQLFSVELLPPLRTGAGAGAGAEEGGDGGVQITMVVNPLSQAGEAPCPVLRMRIV
jgi:hypothetical protein